MNIDDALLCAIIVALARTWNSKLPGFAAEFKDQIDGIKLTTPVLTESGLRQTLDQLSQMLE
jgi:hypothetical protein